VDALKANDLELNRGLDPAQKLSQALEMMSAGIRLKRSALRAQFPEASEVEIARLLTVWLTKDG
jgi:Rv0078B-related antitoxin